MHNVFEVVKAIIDSKYPNGITIEDSQNTDKAMKSTIDSINKTKTLTKAESIKQDRLFRKQQRIKEVKGLKALGLSISEIGRRTNLDFRTVSKYINI
jgi:DNA-binding NarL/FixJ family response regulator